VTVASATDRVRVEADAEVTTTVRLAEESTDVEVVDKSGDQLIAVEIPRSEDRVDIAVDVKGDIEVFEPDSISAEERIEAVEKSTKLIVADDVEARTVEVTPASIDKVDKTKLRVLSVAEAEKTFTTTTVLEKTVTDSREELEISEQNSDTAERITDDDVTTIEIDESTQSATLLLSDGSKIKVRIGEDGELVTSDGRTLEVELEPETQKELKRLDPKEVESDQTLKDTTSSDRKLERTDDSTKTTDPSTGTQQDRGALEDTADKKPDSSGDSALDDTDSKDTTPKSERNEKPEPSTSLDSSKQQTENAPRVESEPKPSTEKRAPSFESGRGSR
jgi:RNase P/RNase MRP subunit p29